MARKTTNTKAAQSSDLDETAATAPVTEVSEQKAEAQQDASAAQDSAASPVAVPEAETARSASEETKADESQDKDETTDSKAKDQKETTGTEDGETSPAAGADHQASDETEAAEFNAIRVTGPKKGRWRAGRHFSPEPVIIPIEDLSEDEAKLLQSDPKLNIQPHLIVETAED